MTLDLHCRSKCAGDLGMKKYYLITTAHFEDRLWFRDEEDYKVAMNYVAVQAAACPGVIVLAFILMSNHTHFVLFGKREDILAFIYQFKQRYSIYYRRKYGVKELLRGNGVDIKIINNEESESLERTIAYVQMNCVAANICSHPSQYPWGTGNTFFNPAPIIGKALRQMPRRAVNRALRSEFPGLPGEWKLGVDGMINPREYAATGKVEAIFRTAKRMNYFLFNSSKAKKRIETNEGNLPSFSDQSILSILPDLYRSLFNKKSFEDLSESEKVEFARQLRFRFNSDANQIARLCGLSYSDAAKLLDSV